MSRRKPGKDDGAPPVEPHRGGILSGVSGFISTIVVLIVIAYLAVVWLSRTEGFRGLVADALEARVGFPVTLKEAWLDWTLDLHLRSLSAVATNAPRPPVAAERVEVDLLTGASLASLSWRVDEVSAEGFEVNFVAGSPHPLNEVGRRIAGWINVPVPATVARTETSIVATAKTDGGTVAPIQNVRLAVRNGEVRWWLGGQEAARLTGLRVEITPVSTSERLLRHYLVAAQEVSGGEGFLMRGVTAEMIDAGDQQIVLRLDGAHAAGPKSSTQPLRTLDILP